MSSSSSTDVAIQKANKDWLAQDRRLHNLLLSSLTEESMAETLGCKSAAAVWIALEKAYSLRSKTREIQLNDELQHLRRAPVAFAAHGGPNSRSNQRGGRQSDRYARSGASSSQANLASTFGAMNIQPNEVSDWYMDSRASSHMTSTTSQLDSATPYNAQENRDDRGKRAT
ncbi:unnamed protein product [Lactuca virosa]|uniref:Uncharacterized protein n=1 Tax=Lactuca virosa TaxID=75947 RepID=A0AAU9PG31_9ASTR|nr:unnamed protein product [Lactuca virosa]